MNRFNKIIVVLLFFCLAVSLSAGGKKEARNTTGNTGAARNTAVEGNKVQVSGTVRLVGNEPFSEIVITGPTMEWYIDRGETNLFKEHQHRTITIEGNETVHKLTFANGLPAGERRILKDVKIIAVQ